MKKYLVSGLVVLAFAGYVIRQRFPEQGEEGIVRISGNQNSGSGSTNTSTTTTNVGPSMMTNQGPMMGGMHDGQYTGNPADAFYGFIQVRVTIANGQLTDVKFLQYPNDRQNSIFINSQAMPLLRSEALQAQSANVNIISGATDTSYAFRESLQTALTQAQSG